MKSERDLKKIVQPECKVNGTGVTSQLLGPPPSGFRGVTGPLLVALLLMTACSRYGDPARIEGCSILLARRCLNSESDIVFELAALSGCLDLHFLVPVNPLFAAVLGRRGRGDCVIQP